jgi:predicted O-methyltransferase YrrM
MWNAKGRHGIHSPYVYDFLDNCCSIKLNNSFRISLKNLYKTIRNSTKIITIEDFGVGSKKMNKQRKVSNLLKTSSSKGKFGTLLYQLAKHYKFQNSLELGTSIGIGSIHLAKGNPLGKVTTVEACSATRTVALTNFDEINCTNIDSINSTFVDFFKTYSGDKFDLVYIDGHHDGAALLNYLQAVEPFSHDETIYLLDDIRWSDSMFNAWNQLKADDRFHVSIDFFRMGILVKRTHQRKENFIVKL